MSRGAKLREPLEKWVVAMGPRLMRNERTKIEVIRSVTDERRLKANPFEGGETGAIVAAEILGESRLGGRRCEVSRRTRPGPKKYESANRGARAALRGANFELRRFYSARVLKREQRVTRSRTLGELVAVLSAVARADSGRSW